MKLEQLSSSVDISTTMKMESIKAELAGDKLHKMWDLLQSPYRDPISSLIREYTSNAFDSHVEAGVTTPVYVAINEDESGWFWACEDFGVGISPDRAKNIFMKYLSSTKEETNNQIGAFGMGSKSGLGYTDVVHIRTRFDGTEYKYMLHKTSDAPTLSLVSTSETDKRNGTQIKIYLKDTYSEKKSFIDKTKIQLAYFDNVVYGGELDSMNGNFVIYDQEHFCFNPNTFRNQAHILIGNVCYPINWEVIDKDSEFKDIPIGLKFNIGDLPVIFTREDIRYTDDAIRTIKSKLAAAKEELITLAVPDDLEFTDFIDFVKYLRGNLEYRFSEDHYINLSNLKTSKVAKYTPNPHLPSALLHKFKDKYTSTISGIFSAAYPSHRHISNGKNLSNSYGKFMDPIRDSYSKYVYMDAPSDPRTNRYINFKVTRSTLYCISKPKKVSDANLAAALFIEESNPNFEFHRQWYEKLMEDSFDSLYTYKYSDLMAMVPEEYEKTASVKPGRVILDSDEVRAKVYRPLEINKWVTSEGLDVTSDLKVLKVADLKTKTIIWAERSKHLDCLATERLLINFSENIKVISVASKDVEVMESLSKENPKLVYIDDWYIDNNPITDCLLFVSKYKDLWDLWLKNSFYRKPKTIPYCNVTMKSSSTLLSNLPTEFVDHLTKVYEVHGKSLDLKHFKALTSWYKRESELIKLEEELRYKVDYRLLLAIILGEGKIQAPLNKETESNYEQLLTQRYYGKFV